VEHLYTALFCEENIWHLANDLIQQGVQPDELSVIFISNKLQQTVIFNQRSAEPDTPAIWDYHVILLKKSPTECLIFDFDSLSNLPTAAEQYLKVSFPDEIELPEEYQVYFRLIDAPTYLRLFSSDRSHMQGILEPGKFPKYDAILKPESSERLTLKQLINFNQPINNKISLMNQMEFMRFISIQSR